MENLIIIKGSGRGRSSVASRAAKTAAKIRGASGKTRIGGGRGAGAGKGGGVKGTTLKAGSKVANNTARILDAYANPNKPASKNLLSTLGLSANRLADAKTIYKAAQKMGRAGFKINPAPKAAPKSSGKKASTAKTSARGNRKGNAATRKRKTSR